MITYYKQYKDEDKAEEITKKEAKRLLEGWWDDTFLTDVFNSETQFRLYTPFADVCTEKDGLVPIAGHYGTVGE